MQWFWLSWCDVSQRACHGVVVCQAISPKEAVAKAKELAALGDGLEFGVYTMETPPSNPRLADRNLTLPEIDCLVHEMGKRNISLRPA